METKLNEKELQKRIDFTPHKCQQEVLDGLKRFNVICAGTRFGKSAICAYIALRQFLKPSQHIWVVAPTYDLSRKIYSYLARFIASAFPIELKGGAITMSDRIGAMRIEYKPIGTWIEFKSAENPTSLLGEELDLLIVDECSRIKKEVWESYLYSRLTSRKGSVVFISTPFGKNWFYYEWLKANDPENIEGAAFRFRSIDNPFFTQSEWDIAKVRLPQAVFKQEHEAEFLDDAASVFRGIQDIVKDNCLVDAEIGHQYTMGVDLGKHEDFTVLTVIDTYNNNVVYWDRFNQIDYVFQKQRIKAIAERYLNARIVIDSTAVGEPIREDLERAGLFVDDFHFTNKSKKELIEKLSIFIEQKSVFIPPKEELLNELSAFGYWLTDSGNIIYRAPEGLHDDCVFSLALAVWGLVGKATPKTQFQKKMEEKQLKNKRILNNQSSI